MGKSKSDLRLLASLVGQATFRLLLFVTFHLVVDLRSVFVHGIENVKINQEMQIMRKDVEIRKKK